MREAIKQLVEMGPLPDSASASEDMVRLETYQVLLDGVEPPVTDEEARALLPLLGADECFGLAWAVVHLVESAPGWPLEDALSQSQNSWIDLLRERSSRAED